VIATTASFFAVVLHWLASLHLHVSGSVRPFLLLNLLTPSDTRPGASYQAPSCVLGSIFGLVDLRDLRRIASAFVDPVRMQLGLLGRTRSGVFRRGWWVSITRDRSMAHKMGKWAGDGEG
jgi:hypothetical protein